MPDEFVSIRRQPKPHELARVSRAAQAAVVRLAETKDAIGSAELQRTYIAAVWAGVVECAVKERKNARDRDRKPARRKRRGASDR